VLYTALYFGLDIDTGSCRNYSMSVSKIREGSGGTCTEWTMGLPAVAAGSGFGPFAGSTGGLSVDLLADGGLLLLQQSSRREGNWCESSGHPSGRRRNY